MKVYIITDNLYSNFVIGAVSTEEEARKVIAILEDLNNSEEAFRYREIKVGEAFIEPIFSHEWKEEEFKTRIGG